MVQFFGPHGRSGEMQQPAQTTTMNDAFSYITTAVNADSQKISNSDVIWREISQQSDISSISKSFLVVQYNDIILKFTSAPYAIDLSAVWLYASSRQSVIAWYLRAVYADFRASENKE